MEALLYLVHRIPFPPNKGDKIRSFHFLNQLRQRYRIHLGAFVDDPEDAKHSEMLSDLCADINLQPLNPMIRRVCSTKGLLTAQALSLPYYSNSSMRHWVNETIRTRGIKKAFIFSSTMAQYVIGQPGLRSWIDFVDVDSDKWRQYAAKKSGVSRFIYNREAEKLLQYERAISSQAERSFFVSEREADLFKQLSPETADRIDFINNGVDVDYFSPEHARTNPYSKDDPVIVFTGAMDYWANVDAVCWFAKEVMPDILRTMPQAQFYIVGSKPTKEVEALGHLMNIHVTGRVEDVRPYLAHANLVVAPMRIARGIQNKVLEGLSMNKPIVATMAAMEGIEMIEGIDVDVADSPEAFATAALHRLKTSSTHTANRKFVEARFSWESSGEKLLSLLSQ